MRAALLTPKLLEPVRDKIGSRGLTLAGVIAGLLAGMFWLVVGEVVAAVVAWVYVKSTMGPVYGVVHGAGVVAGGLVLLAVARATRLRDPFWRLSAPLERGRFVWAVILAVAVVRLAWVTLVPTAPHSDGIIYDNLARRLLETGQYFTSRTQAHWPPGYPLWIAGVYAVFGGSLAAVKVSHVVLAGLAEWCAWKWVARYADRRTAGLALLLLACWPSRTLRLDVVSYDDLVAALVMLSLLAMPDVRLARGGGWRWVIAGLLLGAACLTRPTVLLIVPGVVLWMVLQGLPWRRIGASSALYAAAMTLPLVPWSARNYHVLGAFVPLTTNAGYNLYHSLAPGSDGAYYAPASDEMLRLLGDRPFDEVRFNAIGFRLAAEVIRNDPWGVVYRMLVQKPVQYLGSDNVMAELSQYEALWPRAPLRARLVKAGGLFASNAYYTVLMLCPLLFIRRVAQGLRRHPAAAMALMVFLSGFVAHTVFQAQCRYHFMYMPFWTMCLTILLVQGRSPVSHSVESDLHAPAWAHRAG